MLIESSHTITLDWVKTLLYGNHWVVITPRTALPWCCATSDTRNHNLNRCVNFWTIILHRILMQRDKLSKSNMNEWTWFVRSVSWIHCAQAIIPSKCVYSYFLVFSSEKSKDCWCFESLIRRKLKARHERNQGQKKWGDYLLGFLFFIFFQISFYNK